MKRKIRVEVTDADILCGEQGNCRRCPIAHALKRLFLGREIEVYSYEAWLCDANGRILQKIALGFDARRFVLAFDEGAKVEPLAFTIEL